MKRYENKSSGISAYRIGSTYIQVRFGDSIYTYDYDSTGPARVERMKKLARAGKGLNTYISQVVRGDYAHKARAREEE